MKKLGCLVTGGLLMTPLLGLLFLVGIVFFFVTVLGETDEQPTNLAMLDIPPEFIPIYQEAGEEFDIDWLLLPAIHKKETIFSTLEKPSPVGAIGHMQFMKCTWVGWSHPKCAGSLLGDAAMTPSEYHSLYNISQYGGYGIDGDGDGKADPHNIDDAIFSAANYLSASMRGSSEEERLRTAIKAYNRADWYVDDVMAYYASYKNGFNENMVVEMDGDTAWMVPHTKNATSAFNPNRIHPIYKDVRPHNGIDFASGGQNLGQPLLAFRSGTIVASKESSGWGNYVVIDHEDGMRTLYAHMNRRGVEVGDEVEAGQFIGELGSTGSSTNPHLHFEIYVNGSPVNPYPYIKSFEPTGVSNWYPY
ncbi:M23 family metallopeptidase [Halobacillus locisalis]|uniref:M23 family metallopeptidase n=1 Tax=Halobacillus locisalis TaxID=220753 RepID=A0A838CY00_9BACI|nr:M23 family metallopeptidase [Halobacillus locisalis]MBA2176811.1 M23 family metallopeptidase [Halobacillus locisalis]